MQQVVFNQYEKIASNDYNNLQAALAQVLQDQMMYPFFSFPSGGVIGTSFACTYVSAFAAQLAAGSGFYYDSSQTGFNPKFRQIYSASTIAVTITANSNSNNRIDLVCLAPNFAVTSTASRYVKTGGTGPVTLTTVNKVKQDGYTLDVVVGTPGASPSPPSVPSGYIVIAQILNHGSSAGMSVGQGDITDERNILIQTNTAGLIKASANVTLAYPNTKYLLNTSGGAFNATFPAASSNPNVEFNLKNVGYGSGNAVTCVRNGSDTFENGTTDAIAAGEFRRYLSDGVSNWALMQP